MKHRILSYEKNRKQKCRKEQHYITAGLAIVWGCGNSLKHRQNCQNTVKHSEPLFSGQNSGQQKNRYNSYGLFQTEITKTIKEHHHRHYIIILDPSVFFLFPQDEKHHGSHDRHDLGDQPVVQHLHFIRISVAKSCQGRKRDHGDGNRRGEKGRKPRLHIPSVS